MDCEPDCAGHRTHCCRHMGCCWWSANLEGAMTLSRICAAVSEWVGESKDLLWIQDCEVRYQVPSEMLINNKRRASNKCVTYKLTFDIDTDTDISCHQPRLLITKSVQCYNHWYMLRCFSCELWLFEQCLQCWWAPWSSSSSLLSVVLCHDNVACIRSLWLSFCGDSHHVLVIVHLQKYGTAEAGVLACWMLILSQQYGKILSMWIIIYYRNKKIKINKWIKFKKK